MRLSISLATLTSLSLLLGTATAVRAEPATQSCLGDWDTFLTCPAGASRLRNDCREDDDSYWGGPRRGPSLMLYFRKPDAPGQGSVMLAAYYKDDQKTGRVFRFSSDGRLTGWDDMVGDQRHGASVTCRDGRVRSMEYYSHNHRVGLARWWDLRGELVRASEHDGHGHSVRAEPTASVLRRPDELCQPRRCDVTAKPDLSGIPAALR